MNLRLGILAGVVTILAGPAMAAQGVIGATFSTAPPGTVGPTIAGDIYGNTSNPSGNGNGVTPSWAPGPWACDYDPSCAGPTQPGATMGDLLAPLASNGHGQPNFANDKSPGPVFSDH